MTHRKQAIDDEEKAKNEETSPPAMILLQLSQPIANGGCIGTVNRGIRYEPKEQH